MRADFRDYDYVGSVGRCTPIAHNGSKSAFPAPRTFRMGHLVPFGVHTEVCSGPSFNSLKASFHKSLLTVVRLFDFS